MTFAWHIAKKDLRLQRGVVAGWILLSLINVADRLIAPAIAVDSRWEHNALPAWLFTISMSYVLVLFLCIANVIQADRVVGTTAFWLTRPVPAGAMLRAKLLGLFLFVVVPSLTIEAILMAAFHVSATTMAAALLQQLWTLAVFMLVIVFGAAVASSVVRLLLTVVGVMVAIYLGGALMLVFSMPVASAEEARHRSLPQVFSDPSLLVIGATTFAIGVLVAIAYQYWQRRRGPAMAIFVGSIAVTWLTPGVWGQVSLFGGEPTINEPWARDPTMSRARLRTADRVTGRPLPSAASVIDTGDGHKGVFGPVVLDGLPAGYVATPFTLEATLEFADRSSLQWREYGEPARQVWLESDNSGPAPNAAPRTERWSALINMEDKEFERRNAGPTVYTGTFFFAIVRHETLARMPLTLGAGYNDGVRSVLVSGLRQSAGGCVISWRTTSVGLLSRALAYPELAVRYRQRDGTELVDPYAPSRNAPPSRQAASRFDAIPASLLHTFEIDHRDAIPAPVSDVNPSAVPRCEDIVLEVERVSYAGHLTRTLELHDFRLKDPFASTAR